jgi:hypothetical protein
MAYNRENILTRIVEIQDITLEHTRRGVTQKWVYENVVFPRYHISYACYNNYLSVPAKTELKVLKEKKAKEKEWRDRQMKLF